MLSGKDNVATPPPRVVPDKVVEQAPRPAEKAPSVMRREALLGRDQRVAGYTFMLRRAVDDQRDSNLPDVQRLYDETLLGNLQRMDIARLLGQRLAFVPIAPANLNLSLVDGWPATGTVWLLNTIAQSLIDESLLARLGELFGAKLEYDPARLLVQVGAQIGAKDEALAGQLAAAAAAKSSRIPIPVLV